MLTKIENDNLDYANDQIIIYSIIRTHLGLGVFNLSNNFILSFY